MDAAVGGQAEPGHPLSSSIIEPAFPSRPGESLAAARSVGDGRSAATRSSASMASTDLPRSEHRSVPTAYGDREVLIRGYVDEVISCGAEMIGRYRVVRTVSECQFTRV